MADLVVSGTIVDTQRETTRVVDKTEVTANTATVQADRVFQGTAPAQQFSFMWFSPKVSTSGGIVYSGPPLADFRPAKRYLIFLKQTDAGWQVAMPIYQLEVDLTSEPPRGALRDLSQVPLQQRYEALAQELETVALAQPVPQPGMTGMAARYFSSVYDLLGGCAEPFYRRFSSSPSPELRKAALNWLELIRSRNLQCSQSFTVPSP